MNSNRYGRLVFNEKPEGVWITIDPSEISPAKRLNFELRDKAGITSQIYVQQNGPHRLTITVGETDTMHQREPSGGNLVGGDECEAR